jgi:hypothetical protein
MVRRKAVDMHNCGGALTGDLFDLLCLIFGVLERSAGKSAVLK